MNLDVKAVGGCRATAICGSVFGGGERGSKWLKSLER